ncbi:MAG: vitamin B12 dependent-methionine synthase activation domain-containing protein, partial [Ferruginibacter sp.]
FLTNIKAEYDKLRDDFANKRSAKQMITYADAIKNPFVIDWKNYTPVAPTFTGTKVFKNYSLKEIATYIDWQPFFIAWEMHGKFPQILSDEVIGTEATKLHQDALQLLEKIIAEEWLTAQGVVGFWPATKISADTIEVKDDGNNIHLEFLRQQLKKVIGQPNLSLADFICPGPFLRSGITIGETTKVPSQREERQKASFGYEWADPMTYTLLKEYAEAHRNKPTEAEDKLWSLVKTKKLEGFKFRRQHIIGSYIADLVCLDRRLIVEVDGLIHQLPDNMTSDQIRTEWLTGIGFKVIRFSNNEVINQTDQVLEKIVSTLKSQPSIKESNNLSSPSGGQGADSLGAFSVAIQGIETHIKNFEAQHDDYNKIMLQALADRLAEAFAELLHVRTRKEFWGYAKDESLSTPDLIAEKYNGIRPAPGYPACPDHTEKYKLFNLLGGQEATGIELTESLAMYPASSVCGWYFAHPESKYFGVGKIEKDQLHDYAQRKEMSLDEMTRWLRPILD